MKKSKSEPGSISKYSDEKIVSNLNIIEESESEVSNEKSELKRSYSIQDAEHEPNKSNLAESLFNFCDISTEEQTNLPTSTITSSVATVELQKSNKSIRLQNIVRTPGSKLVYSTLENEDPHLNHKQLFVNKAIFCFQCYTRFDEILGRFNFNISSFQEDVCQVLYEFFRPDTLWYLLRTFKNYGFPAEQLNGSHMIQLKSQMNRLNIQSFMIFVNFYRDTKFTAPVHSYDDSFFAEIFMRNPEICSSNIESLHKVLTEVSFFQQLESRNIKFLKMTKIYQSIITDPHRVNIENLKIIINGILKSNSIINGFKMSFLFSALYNCNFELNEKLVSSTFNELNPLLENCTINKHNETILECISTRLPEFLRKMKPGRIKQVSDEIQQITEDKTLYIRPEVFLYLATTESKIEPGSIKRFNNTIAFLYGITQKPKVIKKICEETESGLVEFIVKLLDKIKNIN